MIEVDSLCCRYGGARGHLAVKDVSLVVRPGRTLGVVGESGSGKTTLARALIGLSPVTSGSIRVGGNPVPKRGRRRFAHVRNNVQMVFQNPQTSLNPRMSIEETLVESLRLTPALPGEGGPRRLLEQAQALLELVALPRECLSRFPRELSGGQLQRVAIARALARRADYLLLDEVTSALDVLVQARVVELLRTLQKERNLGYLMITHDLAVASSLSHDLLVMRQGEVAEMGSTRQLLASPSQQYTRDLVAATPRVGGARWRVADAHQPMSPDGRESR